MLQYKAGYKFVQSGVHAQVLDFAAAITCAENLDEARRSLALTLRDVAETALTMVLVFHSPNPLASDAEMDIEESIYLHLQVNAPT